MNDDQELHLNLLYTEQNTLRAVPLYSQEECDMVKNDNSGSRQLSELWQYIRYLQSLLDREGIAYDAMKEKADSSFHAGEITPEHAKLLFSVFKGRNDVCSKRTKLKSGNFAYFPACENFWRYGVCPRTEHKPVKS